LSLPLDTAVATEERANANPSKGSASPRTSPGWQHRDLVPLEGEDERLAVKKYIIPGQTQRLTIG
jgi:hypothetical protein